MSYVKELISDLITIEVTKRWNSIEYNPDGTRSRISVFEEVVSEFHAAVQKTVFISKGRTSPQ